MINDFPSYGELSIYVTEHPEYHEHFEDYSKTCHSEMKDIYIMLNYTWPNDASKTIRIYGHRLNKRGGMSKMQSVYYMFIVSLRLILQNNNEKYEDLHDMTRIIDRAWNGIGYWRY